MRNCRPLYGQWNMAHLHSSTKTEFIKLTRTLREGMPKAHAMLIFKPRSESSLPLIIMQLHVLLLMACMRPLQQSSVGAMALPPTYGMETCCNTCHCSTPFCFFCTDCPIAQVNNINDIAETIHGSPILV